MSASPRIISLNPYGSRQAWLDDDGSTVYLHMGPPGTPLVAEQSLWVRNNQPAPVEVDPAVLAPPGQRGPQPRRATRHVHGKPLIPGQVLELIWFEEGDGVALLIDGEVEAILPSWSQPEMRGYAAEARARGPFAWPLVMPNPLSVRVARARAHWDALNQGTLWPQSAEASIAYLEERLGPHEGFYAIAGQSGPPRAVAVFKEKTLETTNIYATVGMSMQPMPRIEAELSDFAAHRRVELLLAAKGENSWSLLLLGKLAYYPWKACQWIGNGHTIDVPVIAPEGEPPKFPAALLVEHPPQENGAAPPLFEGLTDRSGDPVTYLWLIPLSARERDWLEQGEPAELLNRLAASGHGWVHDPARSSIF